MSEVVETTTVEVPAAAPAAATPLDDSAGLDAGFKKVRPEEDRPTSPALEKAIETEAKEPTAASPAKPATEPKAEETKTAEPAAERVVFAGLTETQLKAALAKAGEVDELRKSLTDVKKDVLGRVGQLQQALKDLPKSVQGAAPAKITKDLLKRLNKDGYEELADALAEDLSAVLQAPAASPVDSEAITKLVTEKLESRVAEINRDYETKLLSISHPDWREIAPSDDWKLWKATLSPDMQQKLAASWDSVFLANAMTTFKTWKANGAKEQDSAKEAKQVQDKRLAAAVTPKGAPPPATSHLPDEAGLDNGFNKVRKRQA